MQRPLSISELSTDERNQLRKLRDRFEQAGLRSGPIDFTEFLPPINDRLRIPALCELIKSDLARRWSGGRPSYLEDYLNQYPELRSETWPLVDLLVEEYRIRERHGNRPALSRFRDRFPQQFPEVERHVKGQVQKIEMKPLSIPQAQVAPVAQKRDSLPPVPGGYKLIKRLGSGSYGEVWQAEAPGGVEAAIKIIFRPLDHTESKRELDSLELMKRLRHPFLLQTQAFWSLEDRLLIAMELADGSLRDRLKECETAGHSGIPVDELLIYIREASEALDYLHSKQVLHRDIKPDNILLLGQHAKLADFGLARLLQSHLARMTVSGTPSLMPPESWSGRANERSDQYSLAGSYVELRLNRDLFEHRDIAGVMIDHLEKTPDLAPLPDAEQKVLLKALAKKADDRYGSCLEFWQALRKSVGLTSASFRISDAALRPPAREPTPTLNQFPQPSPTPVGVSGDVAPGLEFATVNVNQVPIKARAPRVAAPRWESLPPAPASRHIGRWLAVAVALGLIVGFAAVFVNRYRSGDGGVGVEQLSDIYLPDGFQQDADAKAVSIGGRTVYERVKRVLPDKTEVVFVLIPRSRAGDPAPFYMLRTKVTNHEFAQFARDNPDAVAVSKWKMGAAGENEIPLGVDDCPFCPVVRVSVDEANAFAGWLKGQLPTAQQWDKAAGRFDGAIGPFLSDGHGLSDRDFGVAQKALQPANRSSAAESLFGCRDMAGNGYEWTSSVADDELKTIPFGDPNWNERVSLRGMTYFAPMPFHFTDRPNRRHRIKEASGEPGASPEIGFRVVLPLPETP